MEVLLMAALAGAGALATWVVDRRRSLNRNRAGRCAGCGTAWASLTSQEPYLIHGRLVCEDCAAKAKKRVPWQLGAVGMFTFIAVAWATASQGATAVALFSGLGTAGMLTAAVQVMKLANRSAQRRIAAGDYPGIGLVRSSGDENAPDLIGGPEGLA